MSTYEESHPVGEEWVDPVFGPVRRIWAQTFLILGVCSDLPNLMGP